MNAIRSRIWKRAKSERGQTMTEYLLVISVLVIGIVAVTYGPMKAAFEDGSKGYKTKVEGATAAGVFEGAADDQR